MLWATLKATMGYIAGQMGHTMGHFMCLIMSHIGYILSHFIRYIVGYIMCHTVGYIKGTLLASLSTTLWATLGPHCMRILYFAIALYNKGFALPCIIRAPHCGLYCVASAEVQYNEAREGFSCAAWRVNEDVNMKNPDGSPFSSLCRGSKRRIAASAGSNLSSMWW